MILGGETGNPRVTTLARSPGGSSDERILVIIRVQELVSRVKRLLVEWEDGGSLAAVREARRCPCGCSFRHLHGHYTRFVVVGGRDLQMQIPRLFCPSCGKTQAVLPWFLAPRSPYPWCLKQAAVVAFLGDGGGYRAAAARFDLDWQLLWAWVDALAAKAKAMLAALLGLVLRYPGLVRGAPLLPPADDLKVLETRARSPGKREALAVTATLLVTAYRVWSAGMALGLPWGQPDPADILGFLARLEPALA